MPSWFAPYYERHPAPSDIKEAYLQLRDALVEPYGQIPDDDNFRWVYDRELVLKRSEHKEEAEKLLAALWTGFLERLRTKYPNERIWIKDNTCLMHRSSDFVLTCLIDFVAALRHFSVPGRLPYLARQSFFDSNPKSLICNPVEYAARQPQPKPAVVSEEKEQQQ